MFLTLDTALGEGSVALGSDAGLLDYIPITQKNAQAKQLIPAVMDCLKRQQLAFSDLKGIVTTIGPGGFTGIRIALSSAQAFGFTLGIPVYGVSTLACMAVEASETMDHPSITAILPASLGSVYCQSFRLADLKPLDKAALLPLDELQDNAPLVTLEKPVLRGLELPHQFIAYDARTILKLMAHPAFDAHHRLPAEPLYIRPPDAKLPSKKHIEY